ncbi:MAG: sugar transferase, partial [Desulfuromonadales bacterium]|nr:sugar transferase [Desulfuromonadales bacterium]
MNKSLLLLMGGDLTLALMAYGTGLATHAGGHSLDPLAIEGARLLWYAAVLLLTSYLVELYVGERFYRKPELSLRILLSVGLALLAFGATALLFPQFLRDGVMLAFSLTVFGCLQFVWHSCIHLMFKIPWMAQKILILGVGPVADQIERILASGTHHYILAGSVSLAGDSSPLVDGGDSLTRLALREKVDKIVISLTERRGVLPVGDILGCKMSGIEIVDAMSFYEQMTGKLMVEKINPSWFIFSNGTRVTFFMRAYKRVFDLLFASVGLILVAPLLPIIALAIRLDSDGPFLFRQVRVGRG